MARELSSNLGNFAQRTEGKVTIPIFFRGKIRCGSKGRHGQAQQPELCQHSARTLY